MAKIVAMIPARLGSKRIKKKNLRLLDGKPLVQHVIDTAIRAEIFDAIYVNSEDDIFADIAANLGVKFYHRPADLASDEATNDDFVHDFVQKVACEYIVQINPTSPLITEEDLRSFTDKMCSERLETVHTVKKEQIEAVFSDRALNFDPHKPMPRSQDLDPIFLFCSAIMGWHVSTYKQLMATKGCATYGADSRIGYHVLSGYSTIDIDNEEDFVRAELAIKHRSGLFGKKPEYYGESKICVEETDVAHILHKDGVLSNNFEQENRPVVNLGEIIEGEGKGASWSRRLVNTENNSATLISQQPGEGNRLHYHRDWNEWWYIVAGEWKWEIEGKEIFVRKGDLVFIAKNKWHKITATGNEAAVRLAVSKDKVAHVYRGLDDA